MIQVELMGLQVETTTGRRYWLFRDLDDGGWFLHGTFE